MLDEADGTASESSDAKEKSKEFYSGDQGADDEDDQANTEG